MFARVRTETAETRPEETARRPAESAPVARVTPANAQQLQRLVGNRALTALIGRAQIQRTPLSEARANVQAEREYHDKTVLLETRLGPHLSVLPEVHKIANDLLTRLKRVVDAWAEATKHDKTAVYGTEFSFPGAQNYYGSFATTGEEIKKVLDNITAQPLRTKLNTVYYSLRGNAFAKFLEAAALELQGSGVDPLKLDEGKPGNTRELQPGFAEKSGLKGVWDAQKVPLGPGELTPKQIAEIAKLRQASSATPPLLGVKSDAMNTQDPTNKGRGDKVYDKAVGLEWEDQPTLTRSDIADITVPELQLLFKLEGGDPSSIPESEWLVRQKDWARKDKKDEKVRWEMGVASIDVKPGSETRKVAEKFRARLDAGISGSTDLMMHAGVHLGLTSKEDREALRLALVAWMLSNRDHSFYEIMVAAEGYGLPFAIDPKRPGAEYETVANFAPLSASQVKTFADLMPEQKLPSWFITPDRIGEHEKTTSTMPEPDVGKALLGVGVATSDIRDATEALFLANHETLAKGVTDAAFQEGAGDENELRRNRVRLQSLREHVSFHWLALHHKDGAPYAEKELVRLVLAGKPAALVDAATLKSGGIEDGVADTASAVERLDLQRLVLAVKAAYGLSTTPDEGKLRDGLPYKAVQRFQKNPEPIFRALMLKHKPVVII